MSFWIPKMSKSANGRTGSMSTQTSIEWTEQTWNPTVGCTKISPGCKNCYAEAMARRTENTPGGRDGLFDQPLEPYRALGYWVATVARARRG